MSKLVVGGDRAPGARAAAPAATPAPALGAAQAGPSLLTVSRFGKGIPETRPGKIVIARADGSGSRVLTTG